MVHSQIWSIHLYNITNYADKGASRTCPAIEQTEMGSSAVLGSMAHDMAVALSINVLSERSLIILKRGKSTFDSLADGIFMDAVGERYI